MAPQRGWQVCAPPFMFSGRGLSFPVQPHCPASPLSGQHFTSHFFSPVVPPWGSSEGFPWAWQSASFFTHQSLWWPLFQSALLQSLGVLRSYQLPSVSLIKPKWGQWSQTALPAPPATTSPVNAFPIPFTTWKSQGTYVEGLWIIVYVSTFTISLWNKYHK